MNIFLAKLYICKYINIHNLREPQNKRENEINIIHSKDANLHISITIKIILFANNKNTKQNITVVPLKETKKISKYW